MKSGIFISSLAILLLTLVSSCKEDIDLTGDAQETAVVYGLLNQADSIHFIKINRAFISNDNSLITAQIPDSNYFASVEATVKEIIGGSVARTWTLEDTIVENKEPGVFFAPEQKLYYFKTASGAPLIANGNTQYQLDIDINEGEFAVSGITKLITGMGIQTPSNLSSYSFATSNVNTNGYAKTQVKFTKGDSYAMDATIQVAFEEYIGATATVKTFDWKIATLDASELTNSDVIAYAQGSTFYNLVKDNVTNNPAITKRKLKYIKLTVTGGSEDLQKYMSVTKPSSSLAQNKPTYTNLSASNDRKVVGIFSARNSISVSKDDFTPNGSTFLRALDANSMRELAIGTITGSLLFCTSNPQYSSQTFYCP